MDRTARLWNVSTGECTLVYKGHTNPVAAAAFSPDGSRIASCSYDRLIDGADRTIGVEGVVHLWNAATGELVRKFTGGVKPLSSIAFTPDGKSLAAGSWDSFVFAWDLAGDEASAKNPRTFGASPKPDSDYHVNDIAFSPDGSLIVGGTDANWTRVWRFKTGEQLVELAPTREHVNAVAFSPDGSTLATAGDDETVRLWSAVDWKPLAALRGHEKAIRTLAWSPDGKSLLSGGADGAIKRWNPGARGDGNLTINHGGASYASNFSPDGSRLLTCGYGGTLAIWDSTTGASIAHWKAHSESTANSAVWSTDGKRIASCSWDKTVRVFDAATREELRVITDEAGVALLAFSPDSTHIAAFCPDGKRVVTGCGDGKVRLFAAETGELILVLFDGDEPVYRVAVSFDGTRVAAATTRATIIDLERGGPVLKLRPLPNMLWHLAWSADGSRLAVCSWDGTIAILDSGPDRER